MVSKKTDKEIVMQKNTKEEPKPENLVTGKALEIWNNIKDMKLDLFSLPNQTVSLYAKPIPISDDVLYLEYKVPAFFPALENVVYSKYEVEMSGKWLIVKKK